VLCSPHNILGFLIQRLLVTFTTALICDMNKGSPVPVSSFLFPTYYPDTGTGSEYLTVLMLDSSVKPV